MLDKNLILQHIQEPEKITMLRHILDLPEIASRNYRATDSDFLDPYEQRLVESVCHHFPDVEANFFPEGERERKIVVFSPPYFDSEEAIVAFKLKINDEVNHCDVLGSILSLGIERSKIGDIVIEDDVYMFVKREIANFIAVSLTKVKRQPVKIEPVSLEDVPFPEEPWIKNTAVVQSMRIDSVIRAVTHLSRDDVRGRIAKGLVKINFKVIKKSHEEILPCDLLSVRGFGRIAIFDDMATTKKGKVRFTYGILEQ